MLKLKFLCLYGWYAMLWGKNELIMRKDNRPIHRTDRHLICYFEIDYSPCWRDLPILMEEHKASRLGRWVKFSASVLFPKFLSLDRTLITTGWHGLGRVPAFRESRQHVHIPEQDRVRDSFSETSISAWIPSFNVFRYRYLCERINTWISTLDS